MKSIVCEPCRNNLCPFNPRFEGFMDFLPAGTRKDQLATLPKIERTIVTAELRTILRQYGVEMVVSWWPKASTTQDPWPPNLVIVCVQGRRKPRFRLHLNFRDGTMRCIVTNKKQTNDQTVVLPPTIEHLPVLIKASLVHFFKNEQQQQKIQRRQHGAG